jgi:leucyl aminopeptidase
MNVNIKFIDTIPDNISELAKQYSFEAKYEQSLYDQSSSTLYIGLRFDENPVEVSDFDKVLFYPLGLTANKKFPKNTTSITINNSNISQTESDTFMFGLNMSLYSYNYRDGVKIKEMLIKLNNPLSNNHEAITKGMYFTKTLLDQDSNQLNPESYCEILKKEFAGDKKNVSVKVLDNKKLLSLGMNMLTSVGRGSKYGSNLAIVEINPSKKAKSTIVLVGKGLTFDTGGVNIKENGSSFGMHDDMGGSATVFGIAKALSKMPQMEDRKLVFISGIVENVTGSNSYQPGEILENIAGQTAIVKNTDAEGRLTMADVVPYSIINYKPDTMITLATLTGAAIASFTNFSAPIFSNNNVLREDVYKYFVANEEEAISVPMPSKVYSIGIKDSTGKSDMSNTGSYPVAHGIRSAGSQTAASFVIASGQPKLWKKNKEGLKDKFDIVHIDIAGTAVDNKGFGTGYAVRSLIEFITK